MKFKGLLLLVAVSTFIIYVLFGDILLRLNTTYFSANGDGLKAYYGAVYHNEYDTDALRMNGMNYPYGEMVFFTGCQPVIANAVRFIDSHLFECASYIVAIMNGFMISSILLAVIFLYLILRRLKLPYWYSIVVAIGIAMLSPQMGRFGGHYSLSWMFWIPLEIYLLMLLHSKCTWLRSILFGTVTFLAGAMHMYFLAFSAFLILFYWADVLFIKKSWSYSHLIHFILQLIVPVILIQLLIGSADHVTDRTAFPWGFYAYRAYPGSVLFPVHKWYVPFVSNISLVGKYSWESLSYIGIVSCLGFFVLLFQWIQGMVKRKEQRWTFTGKPITDLLLAASFAALLFSMGIPFIFGLDKLRSMVGPISQLRAIARFAWLFYYVINIVVFVKLYGVMRTNKIQPFIKYSATLFCMGILLFEGWQYASSNVGVLNNKIDELEDTVNELPQNKWIKGIDSDDYQFIMPLPYFHIGSESSWIESKCDMAKQVYIASLKTGLPTNAVMLSRTSLSQTYKNIELTLEPWNNYRVIDDFKNDKPILLMVAKCDEIGVNEQRLVDFANFVSENDKFKLYQLSIDSLKLIPQRVGLPVRYADTQDSIHSLINKGDKSVVSKTFSNSENEQNTFELTILSCFACR